MDSVMYSTLHPPLDRIGEYDSPTPVAVSAGQATGSAEEVIVLPWNDLDVLTKAVEEHKDHLAAIITEAIACNVNSSLPRAGYLEGVRKLCDDNGIVLIFDEVITGFRIALGGAQEYLGVTPDMGVFAKAMAGGFPISMVAAKRDLMASLEDSTTVLAGTYNSNVMVMAAAQACISKLMEDDGAVYEHIYSVGTRLMDGLRTLSVTHEEDVLIQGLGPAFHLIFTTQKELPDYRSDARSSDTERYLLFRTGMLERGVRLLNDGRWFLSTAHTEEDIDRTLDAADQTLRSM
jgi:glutamate-1-semialdehyde 2,1-aminomutase